MIDPVCGRELGAGDARSSVVFRGRRWYFCDDPARGCQRVFKRSPERWVEARPEAGSPVGPIVPARTRAVSPFRVVTGGAGVVDDGRYDTGEVDSAVGSPNDPDDSRPVDASDEETS